MADSTGANSSQNADAMLRLAYCRVLERSQFQSGFLARSAHELRSPLNKIISLQQMILAGLCEDPDEEREFVVEAQAASLKLLEYLDFLIRISKLEVGRIVPDMQMVCLADIFTQVQEMMQLQAADRNLRLVVQPPDETVQVWADPTWLRNALATLIDMAISHCDRGTISLFLAPESPSHHWHIWLEDDRPVRCWQELVTLPARQDFDLSDTLSDTLRMGMVETSLKAMQGALTLLSTPTAADSAPTRLQCRLWRQPETERSPEVVP